MTSDPWDEDRVSSFPPQDTETTHSRERERERGPSHTRGFSFHTLNTRNPLFLSLVFFSLSLSFYDAERREGLSLCFNQEICNRLKEHVMTDETRRPSTPSLLFLCVVPITFFFFKKNVNFYKVKLDISLIDGVIYLAPIGELCNQRTCWHQRVAFFPPFFLVASKRRGRGRLGWCRYKSVGRQTRVSCHTESPELKKTLGSSSTLRTHTHTHTRKEKKKARKNDDDETQILLPLKTHTGHNRPIYILGVGTHTETGLLNVPFSVGALSLSLFAWNDEDTLTQEVQRSNALIINQQRREPLRSARLPNCFFSKKSGEREREGKQERENLRPNKQAPNSGESPLFFLLRCFDWNDVALDLFSTPLAQPNTPYNKNYFYFIPPSLSILERRVKTERYIYPAGSVSICQAPWPSRYIHTHTRMRREREKVGNDVYLYGLSGLYISRRGERETAAPGSLNAHSLI